MGAPICAGVGKIAGNSGNSRLFSAFEFPAAQYLPVLTRKWVEIGKNGQYSVVF